MFNRDGRIKSTLLVLKLECHCLAILTLILSYGGFERGRIAVCYFFGTLVDLHCRGFWKGILFFSTFKKFLRFGRETEKKRSFGKGRDAVCEQHPKPLALRY